MNTEQYITSNLDSIQPKLSKKSIRIAFVGISSLMQFSFLDYLKEKHLCLELVICFESNWFLTKQFLAENGYHHTKVFPISDQFQKKKFFSKEVYSNLSAICKVLNISHFIISPVLENLSLFSNFILKEKYSMLLCSNLFEFSHIQPFLHEYSRIKSNSSSKLMIMNSYDFHLGYLYLKKLIQDVVNQYQVPVSYVGMQSLISGFELWQSGRIHSYFLLSDIMKMNAGILDDSKRVIKSKIFDHRISSQNVGFNQNYAKVIHFYNKKKQVVSVADYQINLMNSSDSFAEDIDLQIHIGEIMKIHAVIHGNTQFDISIYRNPEFLKGKREEFVQLSDFYCKENISSLEEANKESSIKLLQQFLYHSEDCNINRYCFILDLFYQTLFIKTQSRKYYFSDCFNDLSSIKKFSLFVKNTEEKKLEKQFVKHIQDFHVGIVMNHFAFSKHKEVYLYLSKKQEIVSTLCYKRFSSKSKALLYYFYLKFLLCTKGIGALVQHCIYHR